MPLCRHPFEPPEARDEPTEFEQVLFPLLDRLLAMEKDKIHQSMAGVLTEMRDAQLSSGSKLYALLLSACFLAHVEVPTTVDFSSLARLLARACGDLQAAIDTGEIPAT